MRSLLLLVMVGCGRFGFDDRTQTVEVDAAITVDALVDANSTPCDPIAQTGCDSSAACYLDSGGDSGCSSPIGATAAGMSCVGTETCTPGNACIRLLPGNGDCTALCRDNTECSFGACLSIGLTTYGACELNCDPLNDQGCASPGDHCYVLASHSFPAETDAVGSFCNPLEGAPAGTTCTKSDDCGPQLTCINGACSPLCELGGAACATGTCTNFTIPITRFNHMIGVCI